MRLRSLPLLLPVCGLLYACAVAPTQLNRQDLQATLNRLDGARQAGRTGTITGHLYLLHPGLPTILRDQPVTLLPLSPALEATVEAFRAQYNRDREPLSPANLERVIRLLRETREEVSATGHAELILTTTTDTKEAAFTFAAVPEGRWLLLAEFNTPLSLLLWASPITVTPQQSTPIRLNDETVWLEGLTP